MRRALFAALALATASHAQIKSDWERENEDRLKQLDESVVAPPALERARLVEVKLPPSADTRFRYFVDWGSVSAGADRIVRYVLVARSPSGIENVSFEGIRCPGEYRVYAVGPQRRQLGRPARRVARHSAPSQRRAGGARATVLLPRPPADRDERRGTPRGARRWPSRSLSRGALEQDQAAAKAGPGCRGG